jgi:hypothetical protein
MNIDENALEVLRQQVKADEDSNRLKQAELNVLRRREQLSLDERDATVKLRNEVERLVLELRALSEEISASISSEVLLSKKVEKLADELADVERGLYSVLSRDIAEMRRNKTRIGEHLERKEELKQHYLNLQKLQSQAAQYGELNAPLHILNAIEAEKRIIGEIEHGA